MDAFRLPVVYSDCCPSSIGEKAFPNGTNKSQTRLCVRLSARMHVPVRVFVLTQAPVSWLLGFPLFHCLLCTRLF